MKSIFVLFGLILQSVIVNAQLPAVLTDSRSEMTVRRFITPVKIVSQTGNVTDAARLLKAGNGQADLSGENLCTLSNANQSNASVLIDFGRELHGGIQIITDQWKGNKPVKVRLRFGESVAEAMSDIGTVKDATNDHAIRDEVIQLPWLGKMEKGNTGFRFVKIDVIDANAVLKLKEVSAIFTFQDLPYIGSFTCSDTLLNKIWLTGAYTVHLNLQDYLWDGIKRDRLVWVGDMHPEVSTINSVFGFNKAVTKSLDLSRNNTPLPGWMNGISTYSMWWVIIQKDWYYHNGDLTYLKQQQQYLTRLLGILCQKIDVQNRENLDGFRFLDWPSSADPKAIHAGLQSLMIMTLNAGADLCSKLNDKATAAQCMNAVMRLKKHIPDANGSKQAAALLALSGLWPAEKANREVLAVDGAHRFSTFYGYYMLQAKAKAGDYEGALNNIREYWGGMLKLGATTFWEDFDLNWMDNAARIDEIVPEGKKDIHGDYGAYCYIGYRHSLCHGWSSGPTPWLTEHVLGVKVVDPGCKTLRIEPHLGNLTFAEGSFPTPYGTVKIKHIKLKSGKIQTAVQAPKEVKIIKAGT